MATVKKIKKAQDGWMGKKAPKDSVYTETGRLISKKQNDAWQKETTKAMNDQFFSRPENKKFAPKKAVKVAPKKKTKNGGALKTVAPSKKSSLGQLPESVRNLMGYQKNGGSMKAKSGASMKKCKYGCN
jgi:hypothetical protein